MKADAVYRGIDGRVCGHRDGETFVRRCKSRHFLQKPPAISIDAAALDQALAECKELRVTDEDSGTEYVITTEAFRAAMKEIDRGFGRQYMVPLAYWRRAGHPEPSRRATKPGGDEKPPSEGQQLRLF